MQVPFVDLKAQYRTIKQEINEVIDEVLNSTCFVGGERLNSFEEEFAAFCGTRYALGVANGTDALQLALRALGIGPGDEVITVANTFIATAAAIINVGAIPVFVDIVPHTHTIDPALIARALTPRTKAIIPVHLYGHPANMRHIMQLARTHSLYVIEDAAQAHGAEHDGMRVGSIGDVACFSFYPGKNLGAFGDAGAITSNCADLVRRIERLRNHGRITKYEHGEVGYNSRLDTLQAGVLQVKLRQLERWNLQRRRIASWYRAGLAGTSLRLPSVCDGCTHVYHLYVVETDSRAAMCSHLEKHGVATGIHYPLSLHLQPAFAHLGYVRGDLPQSERMAERILSLPMYPEMTPDQVATVIAAVRAADGRDKVTEGLGGAVRCTPGAQRSGVPL